MKTNGHQTNKAPAFALRAERALSEEEALAKGMEEPSTARWTILRIARQGEAQRSQKSKEFVEKGAEVFAKA